MRSRRGIRKPMAGVPSVVTDSGACLPREARACFSKSVPPAFPNSQEASSILAIGLHPFYVPRLTLFLFKVWGKVSLCSPVGPEICGDPSSSVSYVCGWHMPHIPHLQSFSLSPVHFFSSYLLAHVSISCFSLLHQFSILREREMGRRGGGRKGGKKKKKRRKEKKKK